MCCLSNFILFLSIAFVNVNSLALKGSPLTRYDPCGLGVVHFDRINQKYWAGIVHFGLYTGLVEVETEIYFKRPVVIVTYDQNTTFDAKRTFISYVIVKHIAPIPDKYDFQVYVVDRNETDIPLISKLVMNGVTLCSNGIRASQSVSSFNVSDTYLYGNQYAHVCGRRSMSNTELVSVGTEANAGDWPWHVAMLIRESTTNETKYDCGGNIISRTAVLTAGHCIYKKGQLLLAKQVIVIAGTNNYKDLSQMGRQKRTAKQLILHPAYTDEYSTSDLGIVKVDHFIYTEFVQPVCIWGPQYDKTVLFGKEATVVGFGATEANKQSEVLRASYLKIENDTTCVAFRPGIYKKLINEFTFCAGYGPQSAINPRNGDSGGGLTLSTLQPDHRISWILRGVLSKCGVSPGQEECDPTYYVVYTDVGPHYGWINHHSGLKFRVNVP